MQNGIKHEPTHTYIRIDDHPFRTRKVATLPRLEVVADEQAKDWRLRGPQACLHLHECFLFLSAHKKVKAGFVLEIAETGFTVAGALMDEVERWTHAEVRTPFTVKRRVEPIDRFSVHSIHVRHLSETKF